MPTMISTRSGISVPRLSSVIAGWFRTFGWEGEEFLGLDDL